MTVALRDTHTEALTSRHFLTLVVQWEGINWKSRAYAGLTCPVHVKEAIQAVTGPIHDDAKVTCTCRYGRRHVRNMASSNSRTASVFESFDDNTNARVMSDSTTDGEPEAEAMPLRK